MATFVSDTMTDTDTTLMTSHTGETGATWNQANTATFGSGTPRVSDANRCRGGDAAGAVYASGLPASPNYRVRADFFTLTVEFYTSLLGRLDTADATGYEFGYDAATGNWYLAKNVAGVFTELDNFPQSLSLSATYQPELLMEGTSIRGLLGGSEVCSATDGAITEADRAGISQQAASNSTGIHVDNFQAQDLEAVTGGMYGDKTTFRPAPFAPGFGR